MLINNEEHNELCVGIDLGTTNSVLSIINKKSNGDIVSKPMKISRACDAYSTAGGNRFQSTRRETLPSCVYYRQENNYKTIVGDFAKRQYALRPHLVAKSIKSQMGEPYVTGLAADIPDQTPAKVASHILKHLLDQANKQNRTEINDVVITVPANFDAAMCKATLEAAQIAGIQIRNKDGSERPILLSEPNAVIYDLINQINNGEIPNTVIDLNTPKYVMVFDLGGGTLDITLHSIKWRDESKTTLKVDEIATNRYTLLGGDDFDEAIAKVMFERYLHNAAAQNPQLVDRFRKDVASIMPQLLSYAEDLKINISEDKSQNSSDDDDDLWDDEDSFNSYPVGGNLGTGYAYDDSFTVEEIEEILEPLLGKQLNYADYKNIASVKETRNIIYPILDVLAKAAQKLGVDNVKVDEVILNGGMSKFYLIRDRLKEFFNLEPIIALDPDQSVSRGAAIYHYYLHQNEAALKDDMRLLGADLDSLPQNVPHVTTSTVQARPTPNNPVPQAQPAMAVEFGQGILNDSLYLGLRNGAEPLELIPTGQELPYHSPLMKGLRIGAHIPKFYIPIQRKNLDGTYRTIVKGEIKLKHAYKENMYVAFNVSMSRNKVLTMNAWISEDPDNKYTVEEVNAELIIGQDNDQASTNVRLAPPSGITLNPRNELNNLMQLSRQFANANNSNTAKMLAAKMRDVQTSIYTCSNKEAFALPLLSELEFCTNPETQVRFLVIARKILNSWSAQQKKKLARICYNILQPEISGFAITGGPRINVLSQAIYALGLCGTEEQLQQVARITNPRCLQAMIYAFGISSTNLDWLYEKMRADVDKLYNGNANSLQTTAYSLGYALRRDLEQPVEYAKKVEVVKSLCVALNSGYTPLSVAIPCIVAIGWICDQRLQNNPLPAKLFELVTDTFDHVGGYCEEIKTNTERSRVLALKLLQGADLNFDEQKYLLELTSAFEKLDA